MITTLLHILSMVFFNERTVCRKTDHLIRVEEKAQKTVTGHILLITVVTVQ